jgi:hypothetical protein
LRDPRESRARLLVMLGAVTVVVLTLAALARLDPLPQGLTATYFSDMNWSSSPVASAIDAQPSSDSVLDHWQGSPPASFSMTWTGSFVTVRGGAYTFATVSDGGSWVYIDQRLVVDNRGPHPAQPAAGFATLSRGVHEIFIQYLHNGYAPSFELSWARDGGALEPVPAWTLSTKHREFPRSLVSAALRRALRAASWLWLATFAVVAGLALTALVRWAIGRLRDDRSSQILAGIVLGSLVLNVVGIWWGVPSLWMGDEITPKAVLIGLSQHFAGGWWDRYPPLQFYVLSAAFSPVVMLRSLHWIQVTDATQDAALLILGRLVSVLYGLGIVIGVYLCGEQAFGKRAGLFAAGMVALLSIFIFYSKAANPEVPYVFWFTASLVFYLRFIRTLALRDVIWCAVCATFAVCTKDQAVALYLCVPATIVHRLWQSNRARRVRHALGRAILDRRLTLAGLTSVTIFIVIHNIPFNATGVIRHIREITGVGSVLYRVVEPTAAGRFALVELTGALNQETWGWPFWIASLIGLVIALRETNSRRPAVWLALVMVAYYVGFIDVLLYNYDRYLLPLCIVQALFGGVAFDRLLRWEHPPTKAWRAGLVVGLFGYTLVYAGMVDMLMMRDSRYPTEQWLRQHLRADDLVGNAFPAVVGPRLADFNHVELSTVDDLKRWAPGYFVLNADYARAVPLDTPTGRMVAGLQAQKLGYRLAFRYRSPTPWSWLPWPHRDLAGPRLDLPVVSILRDVNPTMEIFQRSEPP